MDQISSDSLYRYGQTYQHGRSTASPAGTEGHRMGSVSMAKSMDYASPANQAGFGDLFADDELAQLQRNLEAIAQLAESALKRFDR